MQRCLVVHLPLVMLDLVLARAWNVIGVNICLGISHRSRMDKLGAGLVNKSKASAAGQRQDEPAAQYFVALNARRFEAAADMIRNRPQVSEWSCEEIVANAAQVDQAHVLHWLDLMADHSHVGQLRHLRKTAHTVSVTAAFKIEPLIISVKVAGLLRAGSSLQQTVSYIGALLSYSSDWMDQSQSYVASRTNLQRHQFTLDVALAKFVEDRLSQLLDEGVVGALLCESSPRRGREWMLTEAYFIKKSLLMEFLSIVDKLWRQFCRTESQAPAASRECGCARRFGTRRST